MNLIVIRHGETDLNRDNRLQGRTGPDEALNGTGRNEVATLRKGLLITPKVIYASPLKRTQETAHILNEHWNVPIITDPLLAERDFGSLSGKLRSEIDPEIVKSDLEGRYDYQPYGGESVANVEARVMKFLETLPLSENDTVIVVTHRGVIRVLYDLYPIESDGGEIIPA